MACLRRGPDKQAGLIFHSDRGSQYASHDFRDVLKRHGIASSMSRKGNCWDCMASAWALLTGTAKMLLSRPARKMACASLRSFLAQLRCSATRCAGMVLFTLHH